MKPSANKGKGRDGRNKNKHSDRRGLLGDLQNGANKSNPKTTGEEEEQAEEVGNNSGGTGGGEKDPPEVFIPAGDGGENDVALSEFLKHEGASKGVLYSFVSAKNLVKVEVVNNIFRVMKFTSENKLQTGGKVEKYIREKTGPGKDDSRRWWHEMKQVVKETIRKKRTTVTAAVKLQFIGT